MNVKYLNSSTKTLNYLTLEHKSIVSVNFLTQMTKHFLHFESFGKDLKHLKMLKKRDFIGLF